MKTIASNFALEFSRRWRSLLSQKDINGVKLAEICGVNKSTSYDWINGKGFPKNDKLQIIADYFGVSINYLLGKDDDDTKIDENHILPDKVDTLDQAKNFLKNLNLYSFQDINLSSKTDKDIIELARTLHVILTMSSKL
jgi:transcriptional regulator with XRE-family HTH domain